MTRIEWIMDKNLNAESPMDFYDFYDQYCDEFNRIPFESYKRYCRDAYKEILSEDEEQLKKQTSGDEMVVTMRASDIKTEDDLIQYGKIDTEKWEVVELLNEFWGNDNNPHYLIKGKYKLKDGRLSPEEYVELFKVALSDVEPVRDKVVKKKNADVTHLISIPDLHNGKLVTATSITKNTNDYNGEIAGKLYRNAITHFMSAIEPGETKKVVLPFGEDYFNVDNLLMTTTKGTPQHNEDVYEMIKSGINHIVTMIDSLAEENEVYVPFVPGNHDKLVSYLVSLLLAERYKNSKRVSVNTDPHLEKVYQDGLYGFMLIHANRMKPKDLAWRFASNHPTVWAETIYREVYSGHYHSNSVLDEHGVRVSFLPSLSSISYWEDSKNYASLREAQMHSFHPEYGRVSTNYFTPY